MGPGRWGSANLDLGVHVTYGDIYNTRILVEIGIAKDGDRPELSHGTHFFNDLVESGIGVVSLWPDGEHGRLDWAFFRDSANCLAAIAPDDAALEPYLRVIDIPAVAHGRYLQLFMNGRRDRAVAFLGEKADQPMAAIGLTGQTPP